MAWHHLLQLALASTALSQSSSSSSSSSASGYANGTATSGAASMKTALDISVEEFWDIVIGPVSYANTTTTVEPTTVPSSSLIPPPFLTTYAAPTGAVMPQMSQNKSWSFPKDFMLGVAGAAYQIEGAVKAEGRGPTIWDRITHNVVDAVVNNYTGDVTDNNYYMYKEDIARLAAIGVNAYSFSIAWARIYPFGSGPVNEMGIAHYNDVINTCLKYNITPVATLYHWDIPLFLQDKYGGWLSEKVVPDFVQYAKTCFDRFGDRVKTWFTLNEPIVFCDDYPLASNYFTNISIPDEQQKYYCAKNAILAHAEAYRAGKEMIPDSLITFKNNGGLKIPLTNSSDDAKAVQRAWDFNEGWFADPIFLTGDWPESLNTYLSTFLPAYTDEEKKTIKGTADFLAEDAYTSQFYYAPDSGVDACINNQSNPLYPGCFNTSYTYSNADGGWLIGPAADPGSPWLHKAGDWLPELLSYLNATWQPPEGRLVVSEFGFSEPYEQLQTLLPNILTDPIRTAYYKDYMEAILISIANGHNILGSFAWSFLDNLEWNSGISVKFGMQYVNFTSPGLERYYKASFFQYVDSFKTYVQQ